MGNFNFPAFCQSLYINILSAALNWNSKALLKRVFNNQSMQ
jgi:hypothetical protein